MTNTLVVHRLSFTRPDLDRTSWGIEFPTLFVVGRSAEGRVEFDFSFVQYNFGDRTHLELRIFSDSFRAFHELPGFFKELYEADDGRGITRLEAAQRVLVEMGAVNLTKEK